MYRFSDLYREVDKRGALQWDMRTDLYKRFCAGCIDQRGARLKGLAGKFARCGGLWQAQWLSSRLGGRPSAADANTTLIALLYGLPCTLWVKRGFLNMHLFDRLNKIAHGHRRRHLGIAHPPDRGRG